MEFKSKSFTLQAGWITLTSNLKGSELGYRMNDCELDHITNFHHDGNIGIFSCANELRYCVDGVKFLYNIMHLNLKKGK